MKKRLILTLGSALALCAAGLLAGALSWFLRPGSPGPEVREAVTEGEYVLSEYGGRVAVFCPQRGTAPRQVTAIQVGLLPSADRLQLQSGIPVGSAAELAMLLEDLGC